MSTHRAVWRTCAHFNATILLIDVEFCHILSSGCETNNPCGVGLTSVVSYTAVQLRPHLLGQGLGRDWVFDPWTCPSH